MFKHANICISSWIFKIWMLYTWWIMFSILVICFDLKIWTSSVAYIFVLNVSNHYCALVFFFFYIPFNICFIVSILFFSHYVFIPITCLSLQHFLSILLILSQKPLIVTFTCLHPKYIQSITQPSSLSYSIYYSHFHLFSSWLPDYERKKKNKSYFDIIEKYQICL